MMRILRDANGEPVRLFGAVLIETDELPASYPPIGIRLEDFAPGTFPPDTVAVQIAAVAPVRYQHPRLLGTLASDE